jgi:hypothetical protein
MKKPRTMMLLLGAIALGGCQAAHKSAPMAQMPATTQSDTLATTTPAIAPATVAVAPPAPVTPPPRTVAIAPATYPGSTLPAAPGPRNLVAADADEATHLRNWPLSVNYYASGHAIAGPVYRINVPDPRSNSWDDVLAEDLFGTFMTIPQMFMTPFWAVLNPPWTPVEYHGEVFPPSYTVDNPLPYYVNEKVSGTIQMKR